jgi:Spy/CpxP family protein refolding chaperone
VDATAAGLGGAGGALLCALAAVLAALLHARRAAARGARPHAHPRLHKHRGGGNHGDGRWRFEDGAWVQSNPLTRHHWQRGWPLGRHPGGRARNAAAGGEWEA